MQLKPTPKTNKHRGGHQQRHCNVIYHVRSLVYLSGMLLPHGQEQWPRTHAHTHAQGSKRIWLLHPKGWRITQVCAVENSDLPWRVAQGKPLWVPRVNFTSQGSSSQGHDNTGLEVRSVAIHGPETQLLTSAQLPSFCKFLTAAFVTGHCFWKQGHQPWLPALFWPCCPVIDH